MGSPALFIGHPYTNLPIELYTQTNSVFRNQYVMSQNHCILVCTTRMVINQVLPCNSCPTLVLKYFIMTQHPIAFSVSLTDTVSTFRTLSFSDPLRTFPRAIKHT